MPEPAQQKAWKSELHGRRFGRTRMHGKRLASFDFDLAPMVSKAQVMAQASGDDWLGKGVL